MARRHTLRAFRYGAGDPTTRFTTDGTSSNAVWWRACLTPHGPATLAVRIAADGCIDAQSWGPGGSWCEAIAPSLAGLRDQPVAIAARHPAVDHAQRRHPGLRIGASGNLYHELLPTVLGQRITAGEAFAQWRRLVYRFGEPAPGPHPGLRLPPEPAVLAAVPSWALHRTGIERSRADTLRAVARHAPAMWAWAELAPAAAAGMLAQIPGVGQWTIGCVLATALGDPDAVAVGDYHLKNQVSFALAGEARGTDERMLELLAPYAGQRGRVVALLAADGWRAPAFGPRRRVLPMASW